MFIIFLDLPAIEVDRESNLPKSKQPKNENEDIFKSRDSHELNKKSIFDDRESKEMNYPKKPNLENLIANDIINNLKSTNEKEKNRQDYIKFNKPAPDCVCSEIKTDPCCLENENDLLPELIPEPHPMPIPEPIPEPHPMPIPEQTEEPKESNCDDKRPKIELQDNGCPKKFEKIGKGCYQLSIHQLQFSDADHYCKAHGFQLAEPDDLLNFGKKFFDFHLIKSYNIHEHLMPGKFIEF